MAEQDTTGTPTGTPQATSAPAGTPQPTSSPSPTPAPTGTPTGTPTATPSPTAAPAPDKQTILLEGGTDKIAATPADWPADWRQKIAGDDKKMLTQLERFGSPTDLAKKIREQDVLIAQGKQKAGLPKDATAEQVAAFRKENGIPEAADKYDLTLPDGLVIGDEDKPIISGLLETMHGINMNNDDVKKIISAYYAKEKDFLVERDKQISEVKTKNDDQLHKDWGNEYRPNLNAISTLVKTFSEDTRSALAGALDSTGMPLLNNPSFLKDMAVMARTISPIDTVVGTGGGNQMSSIDDEIKAIEARMSGPERDAYFKDDKAQKRLLQLYDWKDRNKKSA